MCICREKNIQTQISTHYMYVHTQRQSLGPFLKIEVHTVMHIGSLWNDLIHV